MYDKLEKRKDELLCAPGFRSPALEKYGKMLATALENKCGLKAICD